MAKPPKGSGKLTLTVDLLSIDSKTSHSIELAPGEACKVHARRTTPQHPSL